QIINLEPKKTSSSVHEGQAGSEKSKKHQREGSRQKQTEGQKNKGRKGKKERNQPSSNWFEETEPRKQKARSTQQGRQGKNKQKVFVNVASQQEISIPSYVFSTLNLGANYQLISFPFEQTRREEWQG